MVLGRKYPVLYWINILQYFSDSLVLFAVLCGDDNLLNIVSQAIDGSLMSHLLQYQFDHNTVSMKSNLSAPADDWR